MTKERILVTVKTYPTLSRKYGETVCTAGVRADGSWVRLYPVPFRRLDEQDRYRLYDWIECDLRRNDSDPRPETYRPIDPDALHRVDHLGTGARWRERRRILLETARVYDRLDELVAAAKSNTASLAVFKPRLVRDFIWEEDAADWDPKKLAEMRALTDQLDLYDDNTWRETFKVIPKLPYNFSYRFEDAAGTRSELQVLEWQAGALYWNCLRSSEGDEAVRQKYFDEFLRTDLHFFLGTTQQFHFVAPNPWVIVGVFPIPHENQLELF